jgi:hypothetical protein
MKWKENEKNEIHFDDEHDEGRAGGTQLAREGLAGTHCIYEESE